MTATVTLTNRLQLHGTFDYGTQRRATGDGSASWRGFAVVTRFQVLRAIAVAGRVEGYSDPEQAIVATGSPNGLRATGASLNVDVSPAHTMWSTTWSSDDGRA